MSTNPFQLQDGYTSGSAVSAKDLSRRAKVVRTQLGGILRAAGTGVSFAAPYGDESLEVTLNNGSVEVAPGAGFVADTLDNVFYFENPQLQQITLPIDDVYYVFAQYVEPAPDVTNPDTVPIDDTESTGKVLFITDASDELSEAVILAKVDHGVVTDMRSRIAWDMAGTLKLWLGYDDDTYITKGSVENRLNELTGDDSTATVITFLSQLKYSESDPRNAITVIEEMITEAILNAGKNDGVKTMQTQTDILTQELAMTRQTGIALLPPSGERSASANVEATVEGIYGDGSGGHPQHVIGGSVAMNENGEFDA